MGVSLSKGGNVSLTKSAPGLTAVTVGLGWDVRTTTGTDFDLDASAICCNANRQGRRGRVLRVLQQPEQPGRLGRAPRRQPDRCGRGRRRADQRQPRRAFRAEIDKIVFPVSIYDADARQQNFGQVRNAFIRVVNQADSSEIARYDLSEDASTETAMVFGELYRNGAEWKFRAVGQGYATGLRGIAQDFGVNV